jgi:hypothetical protein
MAANNKEKTKMKVQYHEPVAGSTSNNGPIGYKRPPRHSQFVPGQSGNPNGRPKGTRNFKTDLREELNEIISFREGDREVSISKQRALIKRLVTSAINGDTRAIASVMSLCARVFGDDGDDQQLAPEDREIIDAFTQRTAKRRGKTAATANSYKE